MKNEVCINCEYCSVVETTPAPHLKFLGCHKGEYQGKWVAEIDKCPKENKGE